MTLQPEHIRVYRRKDVIRPVYVKGDTSLAKTLIAVYRSHVGGRRGTLGDAVSDCEELGYDYRLVRGLAATLDSRCVYESRASVPPLQARRTAFREAAGRVVASERERVEVMEAAAARLGVTAQELDESLYGDLEEEQALAEFHEPTAEELLRFYNYGNTVALLSYATGIEATHAGWDEYLVRLAEKVGDAEPRRMGAATEITIKLKPTNRLHQRGSRIDEFLARLLTAESWSLRATIVYPARRKQPAVMEISSASHGDLLTKDPHGEELIIEIPAREPRRPRHGDLIVLEELAQRRGVTEAQLLREIEEEGFEYRDLGGVLVTPGKLEEINRALGGVETLGEARKVLRMSGVRSFMPVLEALGYQVEPRRPRDQSRVYRL